MAPWSMAPSVTQGVRPLQTSLDNDSIVKYRGVGKHDQRKIVEISPTEVWNVERKKNILVQPRSNQKYFNHYLLIVGKSVSMLMIEA